MEKPQQYIDENYILCSFRVVMSTVSSSITIAPQKNDDYICCVLWKIW